MSARRRGGVRSLRWIGLLLPLVAFFPVVAAAQQTPPAGEEAESPAQRMARLFEGEYLALLEAEIERARERGLPVEPLVLKALEGRSKGADDARIVAAVKALCDRLLHASRLLGEEASSASLVAAAGALYLGVEAGSIREMREAMGGDAMEMGLVVLGDLVRRGVPAPDASRAIARMGSAGLDAPGFAEFRDLVDSDIRTGVAPERATEVRMRGVLARHGGGGA